MRLSSQRARESRRKWQNLEVRERQTRQVGERQTLLLPLHSRLIVVLVLALFATACGGGETTVAEDDERTEAAASEPTTPPDASLPESDGSDEGDSTVPAPESTKPEPVPYIPADSPGSAQDYAELIAELENEVPADLRSQVPWPDLRNPNPIVAQQDIFELWIWMAANHPNPDLVEIMAAPGSPSREEVVSVFGRIDRSGNLETRTGAPYVAFDHVVVTFESSGLPLWLARDVPEDAVVVYYSDQSGPTTVTNRETEEVVDVRPPVSRRAWLSIMVPTDVGWQLWRDQLIEPNDAELETPDVPPPPSQTDERPNPEV